MRSHPLRPNSDPAHGRFASSPRTAAAAAIDNMMAAERSDPPPINVVNASTRPSATTIRPERRDERERDSGEHGQLTQHPQAGSCRNRHVAVGAVDHRAVGVDTAAVERLDPGTSTKQVDDPRNRRVARQSTPPTDRQQLRRQRHGGVHDQGGNSGPGGREQAGEPPDPEVPDDQQSQHADGVQQTHVEEGDGAGKCRQRHARRHGRRRAETVPPPAGAVVRRASPSD